nr:MAG TPA: hypothetical protein [Crassvirales sp.]
MPNLSIPVIIIFLICVPNKLEAFICAGTLVCIL